MNFKNNILSIAILIGFAFTGIVEAQFAQFKNPLGGGSSDSGSGDITATQEKLINDLADALGDVLSAQAIIAEAQGKKELAASLNNTSTKMKGGSYTNDDIQGAVTTSQDTIDALGGVMSEGENLSAESKALYAKAVLPYAKSVAKTAKLSGPIKDFTKEAQNAIKSIKNPMEIRKLKKSLDTGLFVGKNVPKLIGSLGKSSKDLITFAKKNDISTKGTEDIGLPE